MTTHVAPSPLNTLCSHAFQRLLARSLSRTAQPPCTKCTTSSRSPAASAVAAYSGAPHDLAVALDGHGARVAPEAGDEVEHGRAGGEPVRLAVQHDLE